MKEQELLDLKKRIDQAKTRAAELKGRRESLMETLATKWKCKTIGDAEALLQKIEDDILVLTQERDDAIAELKEKYDL